MKDLHADPTRFNEFKKAKDLALEVEKLMGDHGISSIV